MNQSLLTLTTLTLLSTQLHAEYVETFFDQGQIKAQTNYLDGSRTNMREGIKHGLEKVYYQSGQLAYEVFYVHGKRDGKLAWLDREGHKLSFCNFKLGKMEGMEKTFFVNGQVKKEVNYVNDLKEGIQKEYFSNGQLASEVKYIHNKKEGLQTEYTIDGKILSTVNYVNNYKEGYKKWFDSNGTVIKKTFYKMDRPIKIMEQIQKKEDPHIYDELRGLNFSPNRGK